MPVADTDEQPPTRAPELERVILHRFKEARQAGLTLVEARLFAESEVDVGLLRTLVAGHCPPQQIARILI